VFSGLAIGQQGLGVGEVGLNPLAERPSAPVGEDAGQVVLGLAAPIEVLGVDLPGRAALVWPAPNCTFSSMTTHNRQIRIHVCIMEKVYEEAT